MTIRPHWINAFSRTDRPEVFFYTDDPIYSEEAARADATSVVPIHGSVQAYTYSHTLYVHMGAHGKPIVEFIEFTLPPEPALEPRKVCSWE